MKRENERAGCVNLNYEWTTNFGFCYKTALQYQWVKLKMQRERERPYGLWINYYLYIYIYIYKTEAFEAPAIFHVSTIFKLNLNQIK